MSGPNCHSCVQLGPSTGFGREERRLRLGPGGGEGARLLVYWHDERQTVKFTILQVFTEKGQFTGLPVDRRQPSLVFSSLRMSENLRSAANYKYLDGATYDLIIWVGFLFKKRCHFSDLSPPGRDRQAWPENR